MTTTDSRPTGPNPTRQGPVVGAVPSWARGLPPPTEDQRAIVTRVARFVDRVVEDHLTTDHAWSAGVDTVRATAARVPHLNLVQAWLSRVGSATGELRAHALSAAPAVAVALDTLLRDGAAPTRVVFADPDGHLHVGHTNHPIHRSYWHTGHLAACRCDPALPHTAADAADHAAATGDAPLALHRVVSPAGTGPDPTPPTVAPGHADERTPPP